MASVRPAAGVAAALLALLLLSACGSPELRIAVFGDSHSDPDRDPRFDWLGYAPAGWAVGDYARAGDYCSEVVPRLESRASSLGDDVVVLFCGTNDTRQPDWRLERSVAWVQRGLDVVLSRGIPTVLVIPPPGFRTDKVDYHESNRRQERMREALLALAEERGGVTVADVWGRVWQQSEPETLYVDGLHLGQRGRWLMAQTITDATLRAREATRPRAASRAGTAAAPRAPDRRRVASLSEALGGSLSLLADETWPPRTALALTSD